MNAEDRDYLSLIEMRNDPDADKRWLIACLKAEAQEREPAWKGWPCIHGPGCYGQGIDCRPDTRKRRATGEQAGAGEGKDA